MGSEGTDQGVDFGSSKDKLDLSLGKSHHSAPHTQRRLSLLQQHQDQGRGANKQVVVSLLPKFGTITHRALQGKGVRYVGEHVRRKAEECSNRNHCQKIDHEHSE